MNIIFVCLGNICRSPMAEYICRDLLKNKYSKKLKIIVDSAGTSGYHDGEDMHKSTKKKLLENKINEINFISKKITKELFEKNDIIFVMDKNNYKDVINLFGNSNKVILITDYLVSQKYDYVPDPWYTNNFDETYSILSESIDNFLHSLTLVK